MISLSFNSYGQTWDELIFQGKKERANGNFEKAADLIFKGAALKEKQNFEHYYYSGVLYARVNNINASFKSLEKAIDAGMYDLARLERNNRLKILHGDKRWDELKIKMQVSEQKYVANLSHPELRVELKQMWKTDQDLVGKWEEQKIIVNQNTVRLNEIIEQFGWPVRSMIGQDGTWMAWAIAQHSYDPDFQIKCLKLLENTLHTNEPEPVLFAELNDRICKNANQKQKFGQAIIEENSLKKFYPIADESKVDERRKSIGLAPLKVYANENYVAYLK
tara:strand:+ start:100 stop:930 length:831 start_codon:yes stop_codon:yes gene_type:complete